ncbi:MAG: 30S ribosomal protein S3 [Patescibacteria group bacterium]|jgi:small subunit ribosomal protein S3
MGHKVNPKVFRLGQTLAWSSKWFARDKDYADLLKQDVLIRKFLKTKLKEAILEKVEIERSNAQLTLNLTASRPGTIIGRGGEGIEGLKKELMKKFFANSRQNIKINIQEVANPNLSPEVMLHFMIADIEKRMPFRRIMKQSIDRIMKAGALGVKVIMGGRLNGAEIARTENLSQGKIPLHTLRANIDYARGVARTTFGAIGIKVWIYKGDVFEKSAEEKNEAAAASAAKVEKPFSLINK